MTKKAVQPSSPPVEDFDAEEQELLLAIDRNELTAVVNMESEIAAMNRNVRAMGQKLRNINLRLSEHDLRLIKHKAAINGLPYQTLLASLIKQYATDRIELKL